MEKKLLKKLIEQCFWDYNINVDDITNILKSNDPKQLKYLFDKILLNGNDFDFFTKIFTKKQINELLKNKNIKEIKNNRLKERVLILKNIFLNEKNEIPRLKWGRGKSGTL